MISKLFRLREGESRIVFVLGLLLFGNALATQISGVVAISGFLSEGGVNQFLIIFIIDMLVILLVTSLQSLIVDRFDHIALVRWMCLAFAMLFIGLRLMFTFKLPATINYGLLYLLAEQQWLFFPLVCWVLASNLLGTSQTKRLFPLIGSLGFAGKIAGLLVGAGTAVFFSANNIPSEELLVLNALFYIIAFVIASVGLKAYEEPRTRSRQVTVRESLTEGWEFVRDVPAFRYLTLAILALSAADVVFEFRFLVVTDSSFQTSTDYQAFFSLFRLGVNLAAFLVSSLVASRVIEQLGLKNAFLLLPIIMLGAVVLLLFESGLAAAVGTFALISVMRDTIDESSRKSFQSLVPDERRGRVSIFMDSYLLAAGSILGCLVIGAIVIIGELTRIEWYYLQYLAFGLIASIFALWSIFRMKRVYDSSMLNWRLKRRQRVASVLDKLEF